MNLFHGGVEKIDKPLILENQRLLDFGKGFYTTTNRQQAEKWAVMKQKRIGDGAKAIVSVYQIEDQLLESMGYSVKYFNQADEAWLDFIVSNRMSNKMHSFQIVKGAVANDTLYATLVLFEAGVLTKAETIIRLKTHKLFDQISFHDLEVLAELKFIESYEL
jgi:hypothetical protein